MHPRTSAKLTGSLKTIGDDAIEKTPNYLLAALQSGSLKNASA